MFSTIRFVASNKLNMVRYSKPFDEVSNDVSSESASRVRDYCSKAPESTIVLEEYSCDCNSCEVSYRIGKRKLGIMFYN